MPTSFDPPEGTRRIPPSSVRRQGLTVGGTDGRMNRRAARFQRLGSWRRMLMVRGHSRGAGLRALAATVLLGFGVVIAGTQIGAPQASAAARSHAAAPAPKPTKTPTVSGQAGTQPGPGLQVTPTAPLTSARTQPGPGVPLPTTGGAPTSPSEPAWPLAVLGLLAATGGIALRRALRK